MANIFKNFLDSLHLSDDEDDDDEEYADYVAQVNSRERRQNERREKKERNPRPSRAYGGDEEEAEEGSRGSISSFGESRKERTQKTERPSKVVQFRGGSNSGVGIRVMKPTSIEDSQDICDVLLAGRATIINLEGFDAGQAQRVMDFISGAVYAIQGRLHQISAYIFIISPENVDIAGDYLDLIKQSGFEVPIINRD